MNQENRPKVDFLLEVREKDESGYYSIVSSVPGLFLAGPDLAQLLSDVPKSVALLRSHNGDERRG